MAAPTDRNARVFQVETRFQQLARRPGGISRERAIEEAQRYVEDMKPAFIDWLQQELDGFAASMQRLRDNPGDATTLDHAYQTSCQLRDVGATMGFELVSFIANNVCGILDAIRAGAAYDKDMIDCHVAALLLAKTEPYRNLSPEQLPEMTSGLRRVVELVNAGVPRQGKQP